MTVLPPVNVLFISMMSVTHSMTFYHQVRVPFPDYATYRNCDICATAPMITNGKDGKPTRCSWSQVCRAVGLPEKPAIPRCIEADAIKEASLLPFCPRGSGDTAVKPDGTMIKCSEDEDCPLEFVCITRDELETGACCRDVSKCPKVGNCPATAENCGRDNVCKSDNDCSGDAKCCPYPNCEGARCIMPFFTGK